MKFRRRPCTPEEDGLLREYAKTMSAPTIGACLKRTPTAIRNRESELGISRQKSLKRGGVSDVRENNLLIAVFAADVQSPRALD